MKKTTFMCFLLLTFFSQSYAQFTENFDASTTLPTGWSIINQGGANEWTIYNEGTGAHSGTNIARIQYNATAHDDYLISPAITVSTGVNDRISFYIKSINSGYLEPYEVLLSTTTNTAGSDFSVVLQSNQTASAIWEKKEFSLASYAGQTVYIAIRATGTNEDRLAVDDFVNDANPSCPQPTALTTNAILPTSTELSWTENGTASLYNVEVVTSGTTPTGTATDTGVNNPFNKTGLTPATSYDYYVQADCGGGDLSLWSGPFTFTTPCNPYTIPYFEGFESGYTQSVAVGGCLTQESVTGTQVWTANSTLTDYNRTPRTGSWNAYLRYSNDDWLFIPIELVGGTSYTIDFYARQDGSTTTDSDITVSYGTSASAVGMTNSIIPATGIINGNYQQIIGSFTPASSGTYYVGIKGYMNGSPWYISLDDISINVTPSCVAPLLSSLTVTNLISSSASLGWTEGGSATTWNVEWGATGFTQGSGTMITGTTTNPHNLTGLNPSTSYDFYVQADCGGDSSTWTGPYTFTTACVAIDSFNENFDGVTTPDLPACWSSLMDNGASTYAYVETSTSADNTAPNGVTLYNDDSNSTANIMLISPLLSNLSDGTNQLRFFARASTDSQDIEVGTITNTADGSTFTPLTTVDLSSTYTEYIVSFDSYFGLDSYIAIRRLSTSTYTYVYLDNIIWETIPACQDPFGLAIANLSDVSGDITWSATSGNYEYVLDTNATDPTGSGTGLATETYNATGLTPLTDYYFHVRTDCGGGTFSGWSTFMFTTLNTPPANNNCANAQVLTLGGVFADNAVIGTNVDATDSNETAPGCALYSGGDVWYQVTIPASGNLTIETNSLSGSSIADTGMAVYSGSCGSLVLIECDDDDSADGNFSLVALTGRTAGEIVYVRVWEYGNDVFDAFQVSAYDASLSSSAFDLTNFRAYPNPVKDILNLEYTSDITSISVFNLLGQEVLSNKVDATSAKIDMSQLNSGAYIVNITIDGAQQVIKVIKE